MNTNHRQCQARSRTGEPCSAYVAPGKTYCVWHDPDRAGEMHEARQRGGRNKSREARARKLLAKGLGTLGDVNDVLKLAMLDCQNGNLDPKIANAMANLAGRIKDLSIGAELEARIDELQRQTGDIAGRIGA
jgi:hypothetical protein